MNESTFNWFKGQELYMFLSLHTQNYQQAYLIFQETYRDKNLSSLPERIKETWEIFRAYLHFLMEINELQVEEGDTYFKKFRMARFVNEVPVFSQDKRGFNIAILVIQIIFSIQQKMYNEVIDRMEAIEKYSTRYLKKDDNFRSNCFVKMLLEIPKESFYRAAVERKTAALRTSLEEMPLGMTNLTIYMEVIPYENLWELVLGTLETKRRKNLNFFV